MPEVAIAVRSLVKRFGNVTAVDNVSFDVPAGSVTGFLGLNGAGKTTTLNILAGVGSPTSGEAWIAGQRVSRTDLAARRLVGFLPEEPTLPGWMTALEAVEFMARLAGMAGQEARRRSEDVLEQVGLASVARRRTAGFSRGMRQRLGLAQALVHDPQVLLLDEPSSALDPGGRRDVLELVQRLRGHRTVLISTHILADVERVCDNVIVIHKGRLVAEAPIHELVSKVAPAVAEIDLLDLDSDAGSRLAGLPWVERVEPQRLPDRLRLRVHPKSGAEARMRLPSVVAEYGAAVARYEWVSPDLEDVFLALVNEAPVNQPDAAAPREVDGA